MGLLVMDKPVVSQSDLHPSFIKSLVALIHQICTSLERVGFFAVVGADHGRNLWSSYIPTST